MAPNEAGRHVPVRMCVICRARKPKACLTRHVIQAAAGPDRGACALAADPKAAMPGRGFYLCRDEACQARFHKFSGWRKFCHVGVARGD